MDQPADDTPKGIGAHLLSLFRSGVTSGLPTSIAHPFIPLGSTDRFDQVVASIDDASFSDAFALAAEHNVAMEVTTSYLPKGDAPTWSIATPIRIVTLAKAAGCRFTLGSDAHRASTQEAIGDIAVLLDSADITGSDLLPMPIAQGTS